MGEPGERWGAGPDRDIPGEGAGLRGTEGRYRKLTRLQEVQLGRLEALGQRTAVVRGLDGLSQFFRDQGFVDASKALGCRYGL